MIRILALLLTLAGCAGLPKLVWPRGRDPDAQPAVITIDQREDELCRHADDARLTLLAPRVFGGIGDPLAYDRHTDAIYAFCLTRPDPSAAGLAWLTAEVRTLHEIGLSARAVLPPLP